MDFAVGIFRDNPSILLPKPKEGGKMYELSCQQMR